MMQLLALALVTVQQDSRPPEIRVEGDTPFFESAFWLTLFLIFLVVIAGALLRMRERDKCLVLLDGQRVTYLGGRSATLWGVLSVVNRGLELIFDRSQSDEDRSEKSSALLYQAEYTKCIAVCRTATGLAPEHETRRTAQVQSTFAPSRFRRWGRASRNVVYTIRDAFTQSLGVVTGQINKTQRLGRAVHTQKGQVDELGASLVDFVGNAYEQLLERQVGKPVILELDPPPGSGTEMLELSGYLVDYTDRFLAVFNSEHTVEESFEIQFQSSKDEHGVRASVERNTLTVTSRHKLPIVLKRARIAGETTDLSTCLLKGCAIEIACPNDAEVTLEFDVTRTLDVVCPRSSARVRFGGTREDRTPVAGWSGTAPTVTSTQEVTR